LTTLLLDRLAASAPARVVTVASDAHYQAQGVDFQAVRRRTASFTAMREYAASKLCNVLFSAELGRQAQPLGITSYALHPGVVASDIWRRVPWPARSLIKRRMLSPEQGAQTSLYCATSPEVSADSGHYYEACRVREPSKAATAELARALWEHSQAWITE
jgi:retinol dehydrogenase 12